MANNVVSPAPAGTTIAADEVSDPDLGTVKVQIIKIEDGTHGGTTKAVVGPQGLSVNLGGALSQSIDSILTYPRGSNFAALSGSGQFLGTPGKLLGIFVSSVTASPTLVISDNTVTGGTTVISSFTLVAGTMIRFPDIRLSTGGYATLTGTASFTIFYDPTTT